MKTSLSLLSLFNHCHRHRISNTARRLLLPEQYSWFSTKFSNTKTLNNTQYLFQKNRMQFSCCFWIQLFSFAATLNNTRSSTAYQYSSLTAGNRLSSLSSSTSTSSTIIMPRASTRLMVSPSGKEEEEEAMDVPAAEDNDSLEQTSKRASPRKRKTRGEAGTPDTASLSEDENNNDASPKKVKRKVKVKKKVKGVSSKTSIEEASDGDEDSVATSGSDSSSKKKKKKVKKKKSATTTTKKETSSSPDKKKKKKAAASDHQRITEREEIPKLWDDGKAAANGSYTFKIASWNVAGLRAVVKKDPDALANLCKKHDLDMLCLQETKLQESHVDDPKLKFRGCMKEHGYDDYWSCSTVKKGYSGTAIFVKQRGDKKTSSKKQSSIKGFFGSKGGDGSSGKKSAAAAEPKELPVDSETLTPTEVSYKIGKEIDNEGRTVIMDFPFATITNVYVPNAGQTLQRLDYRTKEWDKDFLEFQQKKEADRSLPVIWLGDLNIAHKAYDVWNDGAKHLPKQAGVTPQERESFQAQLDTGFVDAFRHLHPEAKGHYSYWSQRAGNREPNKGLRLDYFICSPQLFEEDSNAIVRDSYFDTEQFGSDHCPAILELEIKGK